MAKRRCGIALMVLLLAPGMALAQGAGLESLLESPALTGAPVGSWADYRVEATRKGQAPQPSRWRVAVVGRQAAAVTFQLDLESRSKKGKEVKVGFQGQVVGGRGAEGRAALKQLAIRVGDAEPMAIPDEEMEAFISKSKAKQGDKGRKEEPAKKESPRTLVGEETITVPAGTFTTKHFRSQRADGTTTDEWESERAHPLGLVQRTVVSRDRQEKTVLASVGTGARPFSKVQPFSKMKLFWRFWRAS
jgi:hypothetical protein